MPWVKYQNHLDGPVTEPAIYHGWRQPSEASGPTLSHMGRTTGRQQGDQWKEPEKPGHRASQP